MNEDKVMSNFHPLNDAQIANMESFCLKEPLGTISMQRLFSQAKSANAFRDKLAAACEWGKLTERAREAHCVHGNNLPDYLLQDGIYSKIHIIEAKCIQLGLGHMLGIEG